MKYSRSIANQRRSAQLRKTKSGLTNLHIWRTGRAYERQKGTIYRREWNNILFKINTHRLDDNNILYFDIRHPLPYPDEVFDAVYLLHVIEHLTPEESDSLLREIYRTLKPGGIIRVSTPDLEDVCSAYLRSLEEYDRDPSQTNLVKYEWSVLELLDQFVREQSGGLMTQYVKDRYYDPSYAKERYEDVFDEFYVPPPSPATASSPTLTKTFQQRLRQLTLTTLCKGIYCRFRELLKKIYDNQRRKSPNDPRQTGEVNKWLYDCLWLTLALDKTGFREVSRKTYRTSDIPDWERFDLDRSNFGDHAIEPSLYMEGHRPRQDRFT
jgi:predicted SAM-dependent methyltransferase